MVKIHRPSILCQLLVQMLKMDTQCPRGTVVISGGDTMPAASRSTRSTSKPEKSVLAAKAAGASARKTTASTTTKQAARRKAKAVSPDQRRHYVEVAAYYIAERRGFPGDGTLEDWLQAESEVERLLKDGLLNS